MATNSLVVGDRVKCLPGKDWDADHTAGKVGTIKEITPHRAVVKFDGIDRDYTFQPVDLQKV